MRAEGIVDALPGRRVLVVGSLPPEGRDLDLLVGRVEQQATIDALVSSGFEQGRGALVRFRTCGAEPVEVMEAESLELPPVELAALLADAVSIPGFRRLARPSPTHAVLLLALRLITANGQLTAGRRERLEQALDEDPGALVSARARAPSWGARRALCGLESAHVGRPPGRSVRANALAERRRAMGVNPVRAWLAGWRDQIPRRRRGFVVALSGLDGAGKSSQATALAASLEQLGRPATVAWTRVGWDNELDRFAVALRRWLDAPAQLARIRAPHTGSATASSAPAGQSPTSRLRRRSALLTEVWIVVVALFNVRAQRRVVAPHVRQGKTVICDRYTLDSVVGLRAQYGEHLKLRVARTLLRLLSPTPRAAFLLDVPAATAFARKGEHTIEALTRQTALYHEETATLRATRLDGERPLPELCAEIARRVWRVLD